MEIVECLKKWDILFVSIVVVFKEIVEFFLIVFVDVYIDIKLLKLFIFGEDGLRFGFLVMMVVLYVYYGLIFILKEIVEEYE